MLFVRRRSSDRRVRIEKRRHRLATVPLSNLSADGQSGLVPEAQGSHHLAKQNLEASVRAAQSEFVREYLSQHPCACGQSDPLMLEFDHLRDKRAEVCVLVNR